jgi:hypothetical protein
MGKSCNMCYYSLKCNYYSYFTSSGEKKCDLALGVVMMSALYLTISQWVDMSLHLDTLS